MLILPSAYLAPVQYYAHLYASRQTVEDRGEHYTKQTYRNRCYIATPEGPQALTIPVVRDGSGHTAMRDIRISDHGNWRHLHWNALVSAYENSPYFEYYADDFRPFYEKPYKYLVDFNSELRQIILQLLSLDCLPEISNDYITASPDDGNTDLRPLLSPKSDLNADPAFHPVPYYQVFRPRTGFQPNLSIVDLLFNMGPESRIVLRDSLK